MELLVGLQGWYIAQPGGKELSQLNQHLGFHFFYYQASCIIYFVASE